MSEPGGARTRGYAGTWPPREAVRAGGIAPAGFDAWSVFTIKLREWVRAEAGAGRLLPWVPIAFGTGIACYFAAEHEPVLSVAVLAAAGLCVVAFCCGGKSCFRRRC
jgi:competence protein ComEC